MDAFSLPRAAVEELEPLQQDTTHIQNQQTELSYSAERVTTT